MTGESLYTERLRDLPFSSDSGSDSPDVQLLKAKVCCVHYKGSGQLQSLHN